MRRTRVTRLLPLLAALSATQIVSRAQAADWYTGAPVIGVAAPRAPTFGVAIDAAVTADTKDSKYATLIGTIAPFTNFDQSGMRIRLGGVIGQYAYVGGNGIGRVKGTQEDGSFLVGYEWVARRFTVAAYIGGDINNNQLDKVDTANASQGTAYGVKVAIDFNWRPTDDLMLAGVASYSTAHNSYYTRIKGGFAMLPGIFVGPEALFLGDDFFRQWRAGGHITGASIGPLQFGVSGGILNDRVRGTGLYGILDARAAF